MRQLETAAPTAACNGVVVIGEAMIEINGLAIGSSAAIAYGGDTINTAVYLARERRDPHLEIHYMTALGDDPLSTAMIAAWKLEGITVDLVERRAGKLPGIYSIVTDESGERQFHYWRQSSAARDLFLRESASSLFARLRGCSWLYLTGISIAVLAPAVRDMLFAALERLRQGGARIAFDSNYRPTLWASPDEARACIKRALSLTDLALVSAADEQALWADSCAAESAERLTAWGLSEVVVKDRAGPCWISWRNEIVPVAAVDSVFAIDSTGAGDAFNAAYLAARFARLDPAASGLCGHALAAQVIQHRGAILPARRPGLVG